ncbi:MAG: aminoacyl-tRNA hydrolase [Opitutales bacterium]
MSIAVLAGLGNPGREYIGTRHNIGFVLVDALGRRHGASWKLQTAFKAEIARIELAGQRAWLVKPQTFMNDSGQALGPFLKYHRLTAQALCAVYDDITLEPGRLKISLTGSDGGHNGVHSLLRHVGEGFARFRIGIGPKAIKTMDLKDHVLGRFTPPQQAAIDAVENRLVDALEVLHEHGPEHAMNTLNPQFKPNKPSPST